MSSATVSEATEAPRKQGKTTDRLGGRAVIGWTIGLVSLGILVYRPWETTPFDVTDYSELLPRLMGGGNSLERLQAVFSYYLGHGRAHFLTSALIWGQWEIFGDWATGWRLFRAGLFGLLIWSFLRWAVRLGVPRHMAGLGAMVFVLSWPATDGWLRFTGEPLAALFLLIGLEVAARFRNSLHPFSTSLVLAGISASMILTKETMIVAVPFLFLMASAWDGRLGFKRPVVDRRNLLLGTILVLTVLLVGTAILLVSRASGPEAYARVYGTGMISVLRLQYNALAMIWPFDHPLRLFSSFGVYSALVLLLGWLLAIRMGPSRKVLAAIGILLLFAFSGSAIYLPWRRFEPFYVIPFLIGQALLVAIAARGLRGSGVLRAVGTGVLMTTLFAVPAVNALRETSVRRATRMVNWETARAVHNLAGEDSLVVAVANLSDQPWQGRGPTLARYAGAVFGDDQSPPALDLTCEQVAERLQRPATQREVVVSYHHLCGPLPGPDSTITQFFRFPSISSLGLESGWVSADLLIRGAPEGVSVLQPVVRSSIHGSGTPEGE